MAGHHVIKIDYQSKDQLISQSINKPNKHAWKRTTNHSINRSIRPSINQSSKKTIDQPTNQSINPSINRRSNNKETAIRCNSASARTPKRKWRNFKLELSRKMRIEKLSWALVQALDKRLQDASDVYVFIYNWDEGACGELLLFLKLKNFNCFK